MVGVARAEPACRSLEIQLKPVAHLQMAVWIEDEGGKVIDTVYVTRSTGALGLGNRPGNALFKSAYRWPYGRRVMVLPVFVHRRGKTYPYLTMGGGRGIDPVDDSIGYHEAVSSGEPFYCPPSTLTLDAISCASAFVGSKGAVVEGQVSYYPPRADLTTFTSYDAPDARSWASLNDLAAVSGATPLGNTLMDPPLRWVAPTDLPDGRYVVRIEASLEGDFNAAHKHPSFPDKNAELRSFGRDVMGQPSVVYQAPITIDGTAQIATVDDWIGYGDWDGATGTLHPKDSTITDAPGTGAGRLLKITDADGTWRLKVTAGGCAACTPASSPGAMTAIAGDTFIDMKFTAPESSGPSVRRYEIRYRQQLPLDDASFAEGIPADMPPAPAAPGTPQDVKLTGLKPETTYYVGVRAVNACGGVSPAQFASATTTKQKFVVLHGCFIATAAYGSALQPHVALLRRFRDRALLPSALGRLSVALYYAMSPPLANAISSDERLRGLARKILEPAVALARAWQLMHDSPR